MGEEKIEWVLPHDVFLGIFTDKDKISTVEDLAAALHFYGERKGKCPAEAIPRIIEAIESLGKRDKIFAKNSAERALNNLWAQLQEAEEKKKEIPSGQNKGTSAYFRGNITD